MTTTTYTVCRPPKFSQFIEWTCARCGHEHLGAPVFVTAGGSPIAVGSGCAAKLVYGEDADRRDVAQVKRAAEVVAVETKQEAAHAAEIVAAFTAAAAEIESGEWGMATGRVQKLYHADRNADRTSLDFPTYVAERLAHFTALAA